MSVNVCVFSAHDDKTMQIKSAAVMAVDEVYLDDATTWSKSCAVMVQDESQTRAMKV